MFARFELLNSYLVWSSEKNFIHKVALPKRNTTPYTNTAQKEMNTVFSLYYVEVKLKFYLHFNEHAYQAPI